LLKIGVVCCAYQHCDARHRRRGSSIMPILLIPPFKSAARVEKCAQQLKLLLPAQLMLHTFCVDAKCVTGVS